MNNRNKRLMSAFVLLAVMLCATVATVSLQEDSDAADVTGHNISAKVGDTVNEHIPFSNKNGGTNANGEIISSSIPSDLGLSVSISREVNSPPVTRYQMYVDIKGTPTYNYDQDYAIVAETRDGAQYTISGRLTVTGGVTNVPVTSITISGPTSGTVGDKVTFNASVSPSNATNKAVTWSISSGSAYGSISSQNDSSCTVSLTGAGSITVKATADDGSGVTATKTITVKSATVDVTSISLSGSSSLDVGDTVTITATTTPSTATDRHVTWTITSGSSRVYIVSETDTSTGGRIVLEGLSAGSVTIRATAADGSGTYATKTITVYEPDPEYTYTLKYNANGGSGAPSTQTYTTTASSYSFRISTSEPTRSGYEFMGWATSSSASSASYQPGDTIRVTSTTTLYAVWQQSVIDITTTQGNKTISTGTSFSYSVGTSVSGCTITVSGASWLSVSGNTVYGTPASPGTYDVTITASKSGYVSDTQTFRITVVSSLDFTSAPTTGLIVIEQ